MNSIRRIRNQVLRWMPRAIIAAGLLYALSPTTSAQAAFCGCVQVAPAETLLALRQAASFCGPNAGIALRDLDIGFRGFEQDFVEICDVESGVFPCKGAYVLAEHQDYLNALNFLEYLVLVRDAFRCP
jgi:hypothetical protein